MKIVTLTLNPALDKSSETERISPEAKLRCTPAALDAGGGGINVSKGIARLGGRSVAVFPVGGHNGQVLRSILESAGITTDSVDVQYETRENLSVTDKSNGMQYRFTFPGAPLALEEARRCLDKVASLSPDMIIASGSLPAGLPEDYYGEVAKLAQKIGARLIVDTSGKPLQHAANQGVFLLKPNLAELSALAGVRELEMNQVDDAALDIIKQGKCEVVVVSLGAQGALLVTQSGFEHVPAPAVKKISTVGAGDSMVAGMTWALSQDTNFRNMAQTGVACGSAATMQSGTQLFRKEDALRLLDWIKRYGERYRFTDF